MKFPVRLVTTLGCGLIVAACSTAGEDATPTSTTISPGAAVEVATTVVEVLAEELSSSGSVLIGEVEYDFAFECFASEGGDVLALGVGEEPETESRTQAVVQLFSDRSYVSVLIGNDQLLELAIDAPAELFLQSGVISGSALRFVDATEGAGVGEAIGLGGVTVECSSFAPGLPEDFDIS